MTTPPEQTKHIHWFNELGIDDVGLVGGKNASLGEMYQELTPKGVKIPNGFAVTAEAYRYFLKYNKIDNTVKEILTGLDVSNIPQLQSCGYRVRNTILAKPFPDDLAEAIIEAYQKLEKEYTVGVDVAVRSSATAEDLPDASFAGQQETFLNVTGVESLLDSCKKCMASLFTNRAISYRELRKYDHFSVGLSIGVQKMVRSDLASSGVMFSLDTESGFQDVVLLSGSWGLGENVVQGAVNPDEWHIFKPTLKKGFKPIVSKRLGSKEVRMVYSNKMGEKTKNLPTSEAMSSQFCLGNQEVLKLAEWACIIEDHYSTKRNTYMPMDMEWAKDGITNELFIVQARPETVHSQKDHTKLISYHLKEDKKNLKLVCKGAAVGCQIGSGEAAIIKDLSLMSTFKKGQILVTEMTDPDWEPILKQASGVVTNRGGRTCHAAIISRELGIPCVVGCGDATLCIANGQAITVDSSQGEDGCVWDGKAPFAINEQDLTVIPKLKTKITVNIGNPDKAYEVSFLPNDGIGLARMEFIVSNHIRVHPLACLHPEKVTNPVHLAQISQIIKGYPSAATYFVEKLAQGLAMLSAAFYPKKVILRFSDFKTNEYVNLVGGNDFEPKEENPMLGWRGASRYYDPRYREGFALECEAVKKVREEFGLTNLEVMIPFVRTVAEAERVLEEMEKNGLKKGENGLRVIGMCEIPANVILAEEFLDVFDGFSIGSNDLTQLTLGLDRDSDRVRHLYDERNPAVKKLVAQVIEVALKKGKYIGICGQAPSDFPEFAKFLVESRIESMSLNPDSILKTILALAETEKELGL